LWDFFIHNARDRFPRGLPLAGATMNFSRYFTFPLSLCLLMAVFTTFSAAQTESVLFSFDFTDGTYAQNRVVFDAMGHLWGTTYQGGNTGCYDLQGCGVVFELSLSNGVWQQTIVHTFTDSGRTDGGDPRSGVTLDSTGHIFGATSIGGGKGCVGGGCGTAFELSYFHSTGWKEKILYSFDDGDGDSPVGDLVLDANGNLYGVTINGGDFGGGVAFELSPGPGSSWTETVLHNFGGGGDGAMPFAGLTMDHDGNLYGTTISGGGLGHCEYPPFANCGTVFELSPPQSGGAWTETILHSFYGAGDGAFPTSRVVLDARGDLFGTTQQGGGLGTCNYDYYLFCGTVFEVSPPAQPGSPWSEKILHSFAGGNDGAIPSAGVTLDPSGNMFGTTMFGGGQGGNICEFEGCGTVYELKPSGSGWTETIVHAFAGPEGTVPMSSLTLDSSNNLYGVAFGGGANLQGVVFEITP
jgi:hypothetical protein